MPQVEALHDDIAHILKGLIAPNDTETSRKTSAKAAQSDSQESQCTNPANAHDSTPPCLVTIEGPFVPKADISQESPHLPSSLMARYNRNELYERVWAIPMRKLAIQYGVSDVALAKTCRKLLIPVPGRGYWAKKAANQPVEPRPPLPMVQIWPMKSAEKEPRSRTQKGFQ